MTRLRVVLAACVAALLITDIFFSIRLGSPAGVRIQNPVNGLSYPPFVTVEGDAWSRGGVERVEVIASHPGGAARAAATRAAVRYRGAVVRPLAAWSARLELPLDGVWSVRSRATLTDGSLLESEARETRVSASARSRAFAHFGAQHLAGLAVVAAACLALALRFRGRRGRVETAAVAAVIAAALWINEYAYHWYWFAIGAFSITNSLMLHMCGLAIVLIPFVFTMSPGPGRQVLFELLCFWGLGGAVQALLAPDIGQHGFPEFKAFAFFVSHGLICAAAVYMIAAGKMSLTLASLFRGLLLTNAAALTVYVVNLAIAAVPPYEVANYFMLGYPPPTGSIVDTLSDLFGPSPRYMIGLEAIAVVLFSLIYLPFPLARAIRRMGGAKGA